MSLAYTFCDFADTFIKNCNSGVIIFISKCILLLQINYINRISGSRVWIMTGYARIETEAAHLAKKLCKNMTVWNTLTTQMDSEEVDFAAGGVWEVFMDILMVYFTVESNLTLTDRIRSFPWRSKLQTFFFLQSTLYGEAPITPFRLRLWCAQVVFICTKKNGEAGRWSEMGESIQWIF